MLANFNSDLDDLLLASLLTNDGDLDAGCVGRRTRPEPMKEGIEAFVAETISNKLMLVALEFALGDRAGEFNLEAVIEECLAALVDAIGEPADRELAKEGIREYIETVHRVDSSAA